MGNFACVMTQAVLAMRVYDIPKGYVGKFVIYIDVSKHMRKELEKQGKRKSIIIFVTGYREYMEVAFDVNSNLI